MSDAQSDRMETLYASFPATYFTVLDDNPETGIMLIEWDDFEGSGIFAMDADGRRTEIISNPTS